MVVRRWGFWHDGTLAIVAWVARLRPGKVCVRLAECSSYVHNTPLPKRLELEHRVRMRVRHDIELILGKGWEVSSRFEGCLGGGLSASRPSRPHHPHHD